MLFELTTHKTVLRAKPPPVVCKLLLCPSVEIYAFCIDEGPDQSQPCKIDKRELQGRKAQREKCESRGLAVVLLHSQKVDDVEN